MVRLDPSQLDLILPAHIRVSPDLTILSTGQSLRRLTPWCAPGTRLEDSFQIERPRGLLDLEAWVRNKTPVQLRATKGSVFLRGLVLSLETDFLFCVSHVVSQVSSLQDSGLRMSDFSEVDSSLSAILAAGVQASMVAESQELMRALSGARDAALAASEAKTVFLANMSHEIRTPLNGVLGLVGALNRTPLTEAQEEMVQLIMTSGQTLERLLSDILDLTKVEAGQLALEAAPFQLGEAVEDAVRLMRVRADDKGLAFGLDLGPGSQAWALGDMVRIRQIVANLVSNAIKFTPQGRVDVTLRVTEAGDERLGVAIEVRDTGIGFDAAAAERMFQRFAQADGTITRRFGGTGLGLVISQGLAAAMGGEIEARSEPGKGSRFTLRLDLPREADPARAAPARAGPGGWRLGGEGAGRPLKVLLVEDQPINQRVASVILEYEGAEIAVANDGEEALARFEPAAFDIILMDMQMPVMDGLTATRRIRAREEAEALARVPIAMLSANCMAEHVRAAREAGADLLIAKPVTPDALIRGVEAALKAARDDKRASAGR
ncbi:ATP-binding protein [Phenylobacterium parvum]|uniref:histidine kinase n=1 Tax=Phenylobacterium parvum TaxID=2201350 RepID=A0A2Z3HSJ7_9CAUL|nr:ATP-binding protein [Phenylobacterium parvum]AWM77156.1 hybrid sensor histidine kinase/response regulator [Phenylobacterium parvum]